MGNTEIVLAYMNSCKERVGGDLREEESDNTAVASRLEPLPKKV